MEDIEYLAAARDSLLSLVPEGDAVFEEAERLWIESRTQSGFVLAARVLYRRAGEANKGTEYFKAHKYALDAIERIVSESGVVDLQLHEVWMQIHYHWRVVRKAIAGVGGSIDWARLHDVATILGTNRGHHARYFYLYIKGLAAAHLGNWAESRTTFAEIRQLGLPSHTLFGARDDLVLPNGKRAVVQGEMTQGSRREFLRVKELGTDFLAARGNWPRSGEIAHAQVRFSFAGPIAFPVER
jgi:hypothetical protein